MKKLGRRAPSDWDHVSKYPLTMATLASAVTPVVLGINWYTNFDSPKDSKGNAWKPGARGTFWIGRGDLGTVRGGHAICCKAENLTDATAWWEFYDQGPDGACTGFSAARCMTLFNRRRYNAPNLYHAAQVIDEYSDTPPAEGSSVRAAFDVLRTQGPQPVVSGRTRPPSLADGVTANRWALNWDDVRKALGVPDSTDGVPLLQSWGKEYPHIVRLADEAGERLLREDGEAAIPTDR